MSDRLQTTLGDLVDSGEGFIQTGPFGSQLHARDYVEEGVPVVMPQQLGNNEISLDGVSRVGEQDRDRLARHVMREGDIVFSRRGDVTRRAYITDREDGWLCGTGCLLLRLSHPGCDNRYLGVCAAGNFRPNMKGVVQFITTTYSGRSSPKSFHGADS